MLGKLGLRPLTLNKDEFDSMLYRTIDEIELKVRSSSSAKTRISVSIYGCLNKKDQSKLLKEIKKELAYSVRAHVVGDWWNKVFHVRLMDKEYAFTLGEYNGTIVAKPARADFVSTISPFHDVIKKRIHDDLTAPVRVEIEVMMAQEMTRAIELRKPSVQVHFKKNDGIAVLLDTVLYQTLRPKGYKYEIRETNEEYIVCVQLTYSEVINDEI